MDWPQKIPLTSPPASVSEQQFAVIAELSIGRRGRLRAYVFEVVAAIAYPILGIAYLSSPRTFAVHSVIGRTVYPFDYIWSIGYILGGVLMLIGILVPRLRWRTLGLIALGTSITLQTAAAFIDAPQLRDLFNGLFAIACFMRAALIIKLFRRYSGLPTIGGR